MGFYAVKIVAVESSNQQIKTTIIRNILNGRECMKIAYGWSISKNNREDAKLYLKLVLHLFLISSFPHFLYSSSSKLVPTPFGDS